MSGGKFPAGSKDSWLDRNDGLSLGLVAFLVAVGWIIFTVYYSNL